MGQSECSGYKSAGGQSFDLLKQCPCPIVRILDIKFHTCQGDHGGLGGRRIISTDTHIVKIWDVNNGQNYTSIEPADGHVINDVCVWPNSGESHRRHSYFLYS